MEEKTAMMQLIEQLEGALTQPFVNKETAMAIKVMAENLLILEKTQHFNSFINGYTQDQEIMIEANSTLAMEFSYFFNNKYKDK